MLLLLVVLFSDCGKLLVVKWKCRAAARYVTGARALVAEKPADVEVSDGAVDAILASAKQLQLLAPDELLGSNPFREGNPEFRAGGSAGTGSGSAVQDTCRPATDAAAYASRMQDVPDKLTGGNLADMVSFLVGPDSLGTSELQYSPSSPKLPATPATIVGRNYYRPAGQWSNAEKQSVLDFIPGFQATLGGISDSLSLPILGRYP